MIPDLNLRSYFESTVIPKKNNKLSSAKMCLFTFI